MSTDYREGFYLIPSYMRDGITAYIEKGRAPGGFMQAVLRNDFQEVLLRADMTNRALLKDWAHFLSYLPPDAWGSSEKVANWINKKGNSNG